ncbi:hypothetical protein KM1_285920 [Entamoeba histolytica HM-3:IMSS]|uniref:Uncharacterized protein n=4 Tax=Entamoeba histolytica TaxID=5759 RepID=C4M3F1_ENTH1|nr:hypothetical protein EHI_017680 [Entamoeba histolytica HM-1:IMSS]EAL45399.1 hypothetical protein EHI_017680 [Entamoeba histolytica HM-1:IMSS]EMD47556.1 Hypothetical protein EHI5A_231610 [Entamoeba histolytica KU27]EMS11025.1 hypothetical protein KM1_285920 [Entamoeba histolytica HM-3:IMSS]GAT95855.1 hypothetical protein CL6EHI_017680 [Entamoeba histolytica]|eukprot:XP_650785.1 hypothetical protein EHI_017680 [Entamoeba histolytica HM-1:IMSS]
MQDALNLIFSDQSLNQEIKNKRLTAEFFVSDSTKKVIDQAKVSQYPGSNKMLTFIEASQIKNNERNKRKLPSILSKKFIKEEAQKLQQKLQTTTEPLKPNGESLYSVGQYVNVLVDGVVRKGKVIVVYPRKLKYLILLQHSVWNNQQSKYMLVPYTYIQSNKFDDHKLLSLLNDLPYFTNNLSLLHIKKEVSYQPTFIHHQPLVVCPSFSNIKRKIITKPSKVKPSKPKTITIRPQSQNLARNMTNIITTIIKTLLNNQLIDTSLKKKLINTLPLEYQTNQQILQLFNYVMKYN